MAEDGKSNAFTGTASGLRMVIKMGAGSQSCRVEWPQTKAKGSAEGIEPSEGARNSGNAGLRSVSSCAISQLFPYDEARLYEYVCYLRAQGAPPSRGERFIQSC